MYSHGVAHLSFDRGKREEAKKKTEEKNKI